MAKKAPAKPAVKKATTKKTPASSKPKAVKSAKTSKASKTAKAATPAAATGKSAKKVGQAASKDSPPAEVRLRKSPLDRKELAEFRRMLLEKRRQLLGDMSGMEAEAFRSKGHEGPDLSTMPVHMADIGTDNYEQEFTLGLLESERRVLRDIDESLDRIEQGTYGICLGTGKAISLPRLRAKPWAKYCIEYARMVEQGLVRRPATTYQPPADEEGDEDPDEIEEEEDEVEVAGEVEGAAVDEEDDDLD